jgi:hypothetical protein
VVAWRELTHQQSTFLVAVGNIRDIRLGPFGQHWLLSHLGLY